MLRKNNKVVYIPAGMSLKGYTGELDLSIKSFNKTNDLKPQLVQKSLTPGPSNSSGPIFSPPKTICKNRSLNSEDYNFCINKNAGFYKDFKNTAEDIIDNLSSANKKQNDNQLSPPSLNHANQNNPGNPLSKKLVETIPSCDKLVINFAQVNDGTPVKSNFKDILRQKLKNAKHNKRTGGTQIKSIDECDCENCDNFINCRVWRDTNISFDISKEDKRGLPLLKNNAENLPTIETKIDNKIILQGVIIPKQKYALDETCIDESIQTKLIEMNCTSAVHVQSYMWTAIQRGLSVFMIAPPKSGKTLSYLPIFCTFCEEKKYRYKELAIYNGPLIVILSPNDESCYELHSVTKTIISHCSEVVVDVLTDGSVIHNCDILITTPPVLEEHIKSGKVHLKRLCHIAIENAHIVLRSHNESVGKILKVINAMQTNRPHHKSIQLVIASEKWSVDLETLLKLLHVPPLVCFEDFLEAAIYSKVDFKRKNLKTTHKIFYLIDQLKKKYMTTKTVVFCEEEEMSKIKETFEISGIECISISNSLGEDELFIDEETWSSLRNGQYKVLLCTDSTFEKTVHIQDAKWLVHYSLPKDWLSFQKRFRCFSKNVKFPLSTEELNQITTMINFMIIDEVCNNQLCLDFFDLLLRNSVKYLRL